MDDISTLQEVLSIPFVVVAIAVYLSATAIRKTIKNAKPQLEKSKIYKSILPWINVALGIPFAALMKGTAGQFADATWGYVVVLGVIAGMLSSFIWSITKQYAKGLLKIEDVESTEPKPTIPPKTPSNGEPKTEG